MHRVLLRKNRKQWNKIEVAILNFDDRHTTFNCACCIFIAHLTFQMRKVFVTSNV